MYGGSGVICGEWGKGDGREDDGGARDSEKASFLAAGWSWCGAKGCGWSLVATMGVGLIRRHSTIRSDMAMPTAMMLEARQLGWWQWWGEEGSGGEEETVVVGRKARLRP